MFDEYDELNNSVQENVNAARVVKAFVREDYEIGKFHGVSKYVYQLFTTAEKIVAWNSPVMQFVMYAVIMIVIKFLGENPGACPWDEAKKYFSKSLMSISSEYTLQI